MIRKKMVLVEIGEKRKLLKCIKERKVNYLGHTPSFGCHCGDKRRIKLRWMTRVIDKAKTKEDVNLWWYEERPIVCVKVRRLWINSEEKINTVFSENG